MKKSVPNQIINPQNNVLLFRNSLILMMKRLLLLLVLAIFGGTMTAQTSTRGTSNLLEVKAFVTAMRTQQTARHTAGSSVDRLENLLYEVQPATYLLSGQLHTYGDNPTSLYVDSESMSMINSNIQSSDIEIVTIRIISGADLNRPLDLSVFSSFPKLKYVYIQSAVETSPDTISRLIRNSNPQFGVFYKIGKGA